ncbi:hypothetical protein [Mesorhizobium sp. LNHC229A00]|uniref:hypothetical protein n=1 Tax=Mesorhizobium sp. LNHC229A00 TaxID=1287240 RepID=UPI0003CF6816|nr:hypothetical protein [Mesorhizobium sp. LNHC229A00]ESY89245.1 hypothetical protein X741_31145 [Mesorhizobium sp. LNHC229A00]
MAWFGTLRALGVPLGHLVMLMVLELVVLATLAGALGAALRYLMAALLLPDVALRRLFGLDAKAACSVIREVNRLRAQFPQMQTAAPVDETGSGGNCGGQETVAVARCNNITPRHNSAISFVNGDHRQ